MERGGEVLVFVQSRVWQVDGAANPVCSVVLRCMCLCLYKAECGRLTVKGQSGAEIDGG